MQVRNETWTSVVAALMLVVPVGCSSNGGSDGGTDSGTVDAGSHDAGSHDAGSHDAGPLSALGAACTENSQCEGGLCLTAQDFSLPGGYCSAPCDATSATSCGSAAQCFSGVTALPDGGMGGACFLNCTSDSDCRGASNYTCQASGGSTPNVCLPDCQVAAFACTLPQVCADGGTSINTCVTPPPPTPVANTGTLTTVAMDLNNPVSLSEQGTTFYVSESAPGSDPDGGPGAIVSVPAAGGTPTSVEASITNSAAVVTDSKNVYWLESGTTTSQGAYNNDGAVLQAPLAGGAIVTLASGLTSNPTALAVDAKTVYYATAGTNSFGLNPSTGAAATSNGAIFSVPIGGSTSTTLQSNQLTPDSLAVDSKNLYWGNEGTLTYKSGNFTYNTNGSVLQAPLAANSTIVTIASKINAPSAVIVDSKNVYWTISGDLGVQNGYLSFTPNTGSVNQATIGSTTVTTLASSQDAPDALAAANGNVYWVNSGTQTAGNLSSVPIGGTTVTTLASELASPTAVVVSGQNVFFTDFGTGIVNGVLLELTP